MPLDAAAAAAKRLADLRALRDDQRAKAAEVAEAKVAEHQQVANAQGRAFHKHAGAGSVDVALLPLLHAAWLPAGCGPDTAWAVAGWGEG